MWDGGIGARFIERRNEVLKQQKDQEKNSSKPTQADSHKTPPNELVYREANTQSEQHKNSTTSLAQEPTNQNKTPGAKSGGAPNATRHEASTISTSTAANTGVISTSDSQEAYKAERAAAAEGLLGITYDRENDHYQAEVEGVQAIFKDVDNAKRFQTKFEKLQPILQTQFEKLSGLLYHLSPKWANKEIPLDYMFLNILNQLVVKDKSEQSLLTGNAKKISEANANKLRKAGLGNMKFDTFGGCQAPDWAKLKMLDVAEKYAQITTPIIESLECQLLQHTQDLMKNFTDLSQEFHKNLFQRIGDLFLRFFSKSKYSEKIAQEKENLKGSILATLGKIVYPNSPEKVSSNSAIQTLINDALNNLKYVNQNTVQEAVEKICIPDKPIQIPPESIQALAEFSINPSYQIFPLLETWKTNNIPDGRPPWALETTIRSAFSATFDHLKASQIPNLIDTLEKEYGKEALVNIMKSISLKFKADVEGILTVFRQYWKDHHANEPFPDLCVNSLNKELNELYTPYAEEENLMMELSLLQEKEKLLAEETTSEIDFAKLDRDSKRLAEVSKQLGNVSYKNGNDIQSRIKEINIKLDKIKTEEKTSEAKFNEYKKNYTSENGTALLIGQNTVIAAQPEQIANLSLSYLRHFYHASEPSVQPAV